MKENTTFASSASRIGAGSPSPHLGRALSHRPPAHQATRDLLPLASAVAQHWRWLAWGGALFALLGALAGRSLWSTKFTAVAQLIRYETPDPALFQPRTIASPTLASMIESTEVRARVGALTTPPLSAEAVAGLVHISPERNSDILNIAVAGNNRDSAVALANGYANEAVRFTQQLQSKEAADASRYLATQLAKVEDDISRLNQKLRLLAPATVRSIAGPRPSAVLAKLDDANAQLADLLGRYTEAHPLVQEQRARIAALEKQLQAMTGQKYSALSAPAAEPAPSASNADRAAGSGGEADDYEIMREVSKSLENQRLTLAGRLRLTQMLQGTPPGYYRIFATASKDHVITNHPSLKILFVAFVGGVIGVGLATGGVALSEFFDPRLKTGADVQRITRLPLLASLGDMARMPPAQQSRWAFRTWTALQHHLTTSPNLGLVCGITSSSPGEGRSLWIRLLSEAANQCGFRVLTITTRPSPEHEGIKRADAVEPSTADATTTALANHNVLATPASISQQLIDPNGPPLVHIPLPGWVWNLERRKEWQTALNHWSGIDNLVILVELPPADVPEAVLLAQNLPNLVWLADCTRATAPATQAQLTTLLHARCNVVGAVLNRESNPFSLERFARWTPALAALWLFAAILPTPLPAQTERRDIPAPATPEEKPATLSITSPGQRADWQKKLTLGPGDVLRLSLFGEPELTRTDVAIQPDGRVSYLEARDVMAAGLTIDELREKLDAELGQYRRAPRAMVAPLAFNSKKYFMLGKVAQKGVFTLDRPMTIVEAVARAKGFETGLAGRNLVDLADLSRSFLVRHGSRAPVNFEKLFAEGDLSQNIPVEPDDYFYFPAADAPEVYLLGEISAPGPVNFTSRLTAIGAISSRGGFAPRAWRQRVLVVRGSLQAPETHVIDVRAVLDAKAPDFPLKPHDIVYVSARPWFRAEDLLDAAASAFAQSVVVFWTTDKVVPVVR